MFCLFSPTSNAQRVENLGEPSGESKNLELEDISRRKLLKINLSSLRLVRIQIRWYNRRLTQFSQMKCCELEAADIKYCKYEKATNDDDSCMIFR